MIDNIAFHNEQLKNSVSIAFCLQSLDLDPNTNRLSMLDVKIHISHISYIQYKSQIA